MKRTVPISILLAGLAVSALAQPPQRLDRRSIEQAREAAERALRTFALLVNEQNFEELGFASPGEVTEATLGDPIEEFFIRLDNLQKYEPDQRGIVISPTRRLTYPVLAGNEQRSSLTVGAGDGGWNALSFGGPNYARLLTAARKSLRGEQGSSSEIFEVRVPALNVSFVARQKGDQIVVSPVMDDGRFGFERDAVMPLDEALAAMAEAAREHNGLPT